MESGDILYGTTIIFVAGAAYQVTRHRTMAFLMKVLVIGGALAFLQDVGYRLAWNFDARLIWLWKTITPDRALIAGVSAGLALMVRDRYAPIVSEAGVIMRRMRSSAEADIQRQWRAVESDIQRQEREARDRLAAEERATRVRMESDVKTAQAYIAGEMEKLRREREAAATEMERARRPDPYKVLGVRPGTSREEIKRRYRELMAAYHPDKAAMATAEIRKLAEEKVKEINQAYETIR